MTAAIASPPTAFAPPALPLARRLRTARRRLLAQRFVDWFAACLLAAGALLLAAGAVQLLRGGPVFRVEWAAIAAGTGCLAALLGTAAGWLDLETTARCLDARAQTHDRLHTAFTFAQHPRASAFEQLTLAECGRFLATFPVARWTPLQLPRAAWFLPVPVIALALLCWHASFQLGQPPADPALDAALARRATALQALAAKLRPKDNPGQSPELARLAAELKRSAARLEQGSAEDSSARLKDAMGQLSALEAMVAAMKQAATPEKTSPAELAALSAALAANPETQDAAQSVQQGKMEQAASQLEQVLQKLQQQGNAAQALQQLAQSMQAQTAKLTAAEKNEVARQMDQAAQAAQSGQTQLSAQSLQRLAELLRKLGASGTARSAASAGNAGQAGPPMTQSQLQNLINALENMKAGLPGSGSGSQPGGPASQPALPTMESFAKQPGDANPSGNPSGQPGSERDQGGSPNLSADTPPAATAAAGSASRLEGVLGDGQTLQELVGAGADHSKASRPYRDLYNAMAPAAQDAVEQEDIPLGSRFFIQRYFENIRP